jgi:cytidylate kinase
MYRAITLYFLRNTVNIIKQKEIIEALKNIHLSFSFNNVAGKSDIYLNDENVEIQIRDMVISEKVSEIAALEKVRHFAVEQQREIGTNKGIVMDGRDIGTTVFPKAELKIFMTADITVRVERRFKELYASNKNITIEEVRDNLEMRDYIDSNRAISPLRKADDAFVLDNTNLSMAQQLKITLDKVHEKLSNTNKHNKVNEKKI